MNDITTTPDQAGITIENETAREIAAQAAPDHPDPAAPEPPHPGPLPSGEREARDATPEPKPLERITSADRSRADIAARFKEKRAAHGGQVEFHGDMRDPSQTYGPLGLAPEQRSDVRDQGSDQQPPEQQQELAAESLPAQPAPPTSDIRPLTSDERKLVKVKVHGREMFLPENEVIAEAQKSLAAGNLLESAKEVLAGVRPQRTDDGGQTTEQAPHPSSVLSPPSSDPYLALAQTLRLENIDSAAAKLKQAIESETAKARQEAARDAARHVRVETELHVSQRALQAFEQAHPDLASDEFARDAVTTQVQREINADLQAAVNEGILKELPPTQDARNGLHTQLRAFGAPVRSIGDIFAAAGTKYASWRGDKPAPRPAAVPAPQPAPSAAHPPANAAPRVELSPDRAQRRAAIPSQPTNGTVPPRAAPPPEQTTAGRRSAAIKAMRKARGQIVA